jgi:pimeloyl-ACP methyl ester carboxylesterase
MRPLWKAMKFNLGLGAGLGLGWLLAQQAWILGKLSRINVAESLAQHANTAPRGHQIIEKTETDAYTKRHTLEDGLERIVYTPRQRQHQTPILMQHGMFHGAWCWQYWQELLAEWGWESVAISLPGHAGSPEQRPIALCTLDYYLGFLKVEAERWPVKPVLMGHSMGGALTQWYLKYVGDLPAAILVAPWLSHSALADGMPLILKLDPMLLPLVSLAWNANPWIRTPRHAAALFTTPGALLTPEQLHARLGPESQIVCYQHNPPFWIPPTNVKTPLLWLTGEKDAAISVKGATRSAEFYHAEHLIVPNAGHNLMIEQSYRETAVQINAWLEKLALP